MSESKIDALPAWLLAYLLCVVVQRVMELRRSAANTRALQKLGAVEWGRSQFAWFVSLHTASPVLLVCETLILEVRPGVGWPGWLAVLVGALVLRTWAVASLGEFWNVRVWVVPGMRPVRRGPYRFCRHPNYLAVALELLCAPMIFGAWRTALVVTLANAALLVARIRVEERAIAWAVSSPPATP